MWLLLKYTLLYAAVLTLVALGGMFSERSGVINIALEGIMVIGGLMGVVMINIMNAAGVPVWLGIVITVLCSALAGLVYSSLLAFSAINLKADQTIGGTALNLLATAVAMVIAKRINGSDSPKITYSANTNAVFNSTHFSFHVGPLTLNWFLLVTLVILAAAWFILYRSRFGMRLMACGEHPQAADSVGINVYKMRWAGVLMSGALGGIGGMAYIVPAVGDWNFEMGVAGMGFLALAVMIFGQWKPLRIAGAALFFAVFRAMANIFDSIPFLAALGWPKEIYNMMPFIASMVVLAFTSRKSRAPKAEGIPYDKGSR
ncbi:MAG: ABC transporter permease [Clostridiales bacterium]|nr:ABC transporter permease [Clostridiales bacterium]MDD7386634.1 ABC transporter permease [Bacillota bacterium]MDY6041488.1 ABC transporter permease [Candidatus Faecousia sp.]